MQKWICRCLNESLYLMSQTTMMYCNSIVTFYAFGSDRFYIGPVPVSLLLRDYISMRESRVSLSTPFFYLYMYDSSSSRFRLSIIFLHLDINPDSSVMFPVILCSSTRHSRIVLGHVSLYRGFPDYINGCKPSNCGTSENKLYLHGTISLWIPR